MNKLSHICTCVDCVEERLNRAYAEEYQRKVIYIWKGDLLLESITSKEPELRCSEVVDDNKCYIVAIERTFMRKYRVWDIKEQKMYYDGFYITPDGKVVWRNDAEPEPDSYVLEQSVGKLDEDKKEIYEGDITKLTFWFVPSCDQYPERWLTNSPEVVKLPEFYRYTYADKERRASKRNRYKIIGTVHDKEGK